MTDIGVLIVGVGGQGTLLASQVLGDVALEEGFDVKVSEVHGMSQRGGSVVTHVRFGETIHSPLVGKGQADYILAFEKLEALRWAEYLKKDGKLIVNDLEISPMPVTLGYQKYPENIVKKLSEAVKVFSIDAKDIAVKCGNVKASNMVMLGVLASQLEFELETWHKVIKNKVPEKTMDINLRAFGEGCKQTR